MQQLAGNENRPGQLGDTGQIVLTKCEQGDCDCNQLLKDEKAEKDRKVVVQAVENGSKQSFREPVSRFIRNSAPIIPAAAVTTPVLRTPIRTNLLSRLRPALSTTNNSEAGKGSVKITDSEGRTRIGIITGTSVSSSVTSSSSSSTSSSSNRSGSGSGLRLSPSELLKSRLKLKEVLKRRY